MSTTEIKELLDRLRKGDQLHNQAANLIEMQLRLLNISLHYSVMK